MKKRICKMCFEDSDLLTDEVEIISIEECILEEARENDHQCREE